MLNPSPGREKALLATLLTCLVAGALAGVWTGNQPGVAIFRDWSGFEAWRGESVWEHLLAGALIGLTCGCAIWLLTRPVARLLRAVAGKRGHDEPVQFAIKWGCLLGTGAGAMAGAILAMGPNGSWVAPAGLLQLFVRLELRRLDGELGFVIGGLLGNLCVGLILALIGRLRFPLRDV